MIDMVKTLKEIMADLPQERKQKIFTRVEELKEELKKEEESLTNNFSSKRQEKIKETKNVINPRGNETISQK